MVVKFTTQGGLLGSGSGMVRLGVEVSNIGNGKSGAQIEYERVAAYCGLKPEWFGKSFYSQGTEYRICGANPGSPKYRLQVERVFDNKQFKATVEMCKRGLEAAVAAGRIAA